MKSLNRILALGTTLTTLALSITTSFASQPLITASQELTAIGDLRPVYPYATTDAFNVSAVSDPFSDMETMTLGTAQAATGSNQYWFLDGSGNLQALATSSSNWRTLTTTSLASSWNATTTVSVTETYNNGSSVGSAGFVIGMILTKTGTVADLTKTQLMTFLQASTTSAITAVSSGTAVALTGAPATGWSVKLYMSTGTALTLDPIVTNIQWTGTTTSGSTLNFTSALSGLHTWNNGSGYSNPKSLTFTLNGRSFSVGGISLSSMAKTSGISAGIMNTLTAGLNGGTIHRLNVANVAFYSDIPTSISNIRGKLKASPGSTSANELLNLAVDAAVKKSTYVIGGFTTTADSSKYGLVAFTASDITSVTWDILNGTTLRATGTVGSAPAKAFTCDMSGITTFKAGTAEVQRFSSIDGDSFWLKVVNATGLDTSADTSVGASSLDDLLVMQLLNKLSSTTTITKKTLEAIVAAC